MADCTVTTTQDPWGQVWRHWCCSPTERELRTHRSSAVLGVHDESGEWTPHGVRLPMGNREWLAIDQAVHGGDDIEGLRVAVLLFAFACLLYSIWRAVDLLVQVELTGEYEHSPMVTADNTLTLLNKETGIG
jgi:hypothetical protein